MAANVKDNLLEMKNLSELMNDLAYSALFLQDKKIASEVEELHGKIRRLEDETTKLLFKVKTLSDEERLVLMDLIDEIKDISGSAKRIAALCREKEFPSIIKDLLSETDERVITAKVSEKSALAGVETGRDHLSHATRAVLIAVKRGEKYVFHPEQITVKPGDILIAVGPKAGETALKDLASGKSKKLLRD